MTISSDHVTREVRAERERLADLFAGLAPEQWDAPSLCAGWRVREVVAHMTMPYRTKPLSVLAGIVRAGFSFHRYADRDARATAQRMDGAALVALLRRNLDNPWRPPGEGAVSALSHDVIHGLDATEPLGLPTPPPERVALVLASIGPRHLKYFGAEIGGRRMTATDADVSVGEGPQDVPMHAKDILLVAAGRIALDGFHARQR
ncbi:maleylpyruvate isomerase family mycothiol-dependent enzyme [Phytomonospora sp. NPDC050363]|uniref:maleylpyruvate isomerase family mycothiol-dependent enzyme n=1 Tax=Phytomonospora sp. NPDC050363 TaxID=3155642 RepID=UPI003402994B